MLKKIRYSAAYSYSIGDKNKIVDAYTELLDFTLEIKLNTSSQQCYPARHFSAFLTLINDT